MVVRLLGQSPQKYSWFARSSVPETAPDLGPVSNLPAQEARPTINELNREFKPALRGGTDEKLAVWPVALPNRGRSPA